MDEKILRITGSGLRCVDLNRYIRGIFMALPSEKLDFSSYHTREKFIERSKELTKETVDFMLSFPNVITNLLRDFVVAGMLSKDQVLHIINNHPFENIHQLYDARNDYRLKTPAQKIKANDYTGVIVNNIETIYKKHKEEISVNSEWLKLVGSNASTNKDSSILRTIANILSCNYTALKKTTSEEVRELIHYGSFKHVLMIVDAEAKVLPIFRQVLKEEIEFVKDKFHADMCTNEYITDYYDNAENFKNWMLETFGAAAFNEFKQYNDWKIIILDHHKCPTALAIEVANSLDKDGLEKFSGKLQVNDFMSRHSLMFTERR